MCLIVGKNSSELLKVGDTSASHNVQKFVAAVTWLWNVDKMLSLRPRDNSDCRTSKLTDKFNARVDEVQQLNTVHRQRPHVSCV